jgi:ATP-binding cassette subfamily F protein 3
MYPKGTIIGYLPQDINSTSQLSVIEEAKRAFEDVLTMMKERDQVMHDLETRTDYETDSYMELINRMQELEHQIEIHDGYSIDELTERVLKGLGFDPSEFNKKVKEFSGGWQMRIELAKILLQKPDLVLLDEPTNHLDIDSVLWLERFLKDYNGAIIMVSHDRSSIWRYRGLQCSLHQIHRTAQRAPRAGDQCPKEPAARYSSDRAQYRAFPCQGQ